MGQITATRNLVATKVVRLAGQWADWRTNTQQLLSYKIMLNKGLEPNSKTFCCIQVGLELQQLFAKVMMGHQWWYVPNLDAIWVNQAIFLYFHYQMSVIGEKCLLNISPLRSGSPRRQFLFHMIDCLYFPATWIWGSSHQGFMSAPAFYQESKEPITAQICPYHDSWAVVTCAKL